MLVEVLKSFEIFLHQLTPKALVKVRIFIWAMRSQGLEPDADCFCNIHELSYQQRQLERNNIIIISATIPSHIALMRDIMFQPFGKWQGSWMKQWFYVKNDLVKREDVKDVIQRPIQSHFGIRGPTIVNSKKIQVCLVAFNIVCNYIGSRDLVQEHLAFKVWPLVNKWEMPMETDTSSSEGGNTYHYRDQFGEPDDNWLKAIEATSDKLLGVYTKAEDEAINTTFGARGKRWLNRVFDVIGFVYPDYTFPARKRGVKRKSVVATTSTAPKQKRAKVLTHRAKSYYSERAVRLPATETSKAETAKVVEETTLPPKVMFRFFFDLNQGTTGLMLLLEFFSRR
jgi:hypothetical protein